MRYLIFALLAVSVILPSGVLAESGTGTVEVGSNQYTINYDATGLADIVFETADEPPTLIVFLSTTGVESTLEISLERTFLDSRAEDGADEDFLVLADGLPVSFTETATDTERILLISVPPNTLSVDIIGTDFGTEPLEETPTEEPTEEVPSEEPAEAPEEIPEQLVCGPGTILQDGVCVLDQTMTEEPETQPPEPEEPAKDMTCGPGTVLQDGLCVLDKTCGPGTVLVDGLCVLDESSVQEPKPAKSSKALAFDFVMPLVAAFVIAFVIMMVLWAIGKAGHGKN